MDHSKVNLPLGLRCSNCWKRLTTAPLQAFPFLLDAEVYFVLQAVGGAIVAQDEGVVFDIETTGKDKLSMQHFVLR